MKIELKHIFKSKIPKEDMLPLFKGKTLSSFMNKLEKLAIKDIARYEKNKVLGDGFEFFVELLLLLHPVDSRLGIGDYTPVMLNDNGVDGVGTNIWGNPCVVQIKYRSKKDTLLTGNKDHLSNMFSDGSLKYQVHPTNVEDKEIRHFIFTTGEGLHFYTDNEMYKKKVKCFGYKDIRGLIDNNILFWTSCINVINNNYKITVN